MVYLRCKMLNVIYYKVGATDFSAQQWRHQTWMKSVDWLWFMPLGHFFERHLSLEHWNWTSDRWFNKSHYSRTQIENWDQFRSFFWYIPKLNNVVKYWNEILSAEKNYIHNKLVSSAVIRSQNAKMKHKIKIH